MPHFASSQDFVFTTLRGALFDIGAVVTDGMEVKLLEIADDAVAHPEAAFVEAMQIAARMQRPAISNYDADAYRDTMQVLEAKGLNVDAEPVMAAVAALLVTAVAHTPDEDDDDDGDAVDPASAT